MLALALGCTVAELLERVDARELAEWMAFYSLDPWGEQRADLRAGIIAATTANAWRTKGRAARPDEFMPFRPPAEPDAVDEKRLKGLFRKAARAFGRAKRKTP